MVRRTGRARNQVRFDSKAALLAGGSEVRALRYQRASQDKKEQGKSVHDQGVLNVKEINSHGWTDSASFTDNDRSASRHATKEREEFERLIEAIQRGKGDVLVIWEISRNQRDLAVYVKIRDMCIEVGLNFWLVGGVLYDLRDKNDRMMLGFQAVQAEWLADSIRDNVLRGIVGAAESGRPHGHVTYGYRRIYHSRTRALERQEADTEVLTATAENGTTSEYTRAGIVKEIFEKVTNGTPLIAIERELNERGVPSPKGSAWRRGVIRTMAMNPAYIGKRVLRGQVVGDGIWDGIVTEEIYWAAVRTLKDPSRTTTRPGRAVYLLSYVVPCAVCDGPVSRQVARRNNWSRELYSCLKKRCAAAPMDLLDEFVERAVVAWLSREDIHEILTAQTATDADVAHARAEADRLRAELEDWRRLAEVGDVTAISFARAEKGLLDQIAQHEQRASEAGIPPVLRGRIGREAVAAWAALGDEVAVKRDIIRLVADIKLLPAGKGSRRPFGRHRLEWKWKFGVENEEPQV
ncbi:recombinase family protein [Actinoplanes sp. NEAU-H7]|uniref:Recombinase family protein n=1 Tax=Actinoplanes flavus TaxID=2820290 RepID=A0ABS3UST3_9ACTN|nr:recombinase family protein [Actinoplanes flavus]